MTPTDLLLEIFPEEVTAVIFDDSIDVEHEVSVVDFAKIDSILDEMHSPMVSLVDDEYLYAVSSREHLEEASFVLTSGNDSIGVFLVDWAEATELEDFDAFIPLEPDVWVPNISDKVKIYDVKELEELFSSKPLVVSAPVSTAFPTEFINNAEIIGHPTQAMVDLLEQPTTFMIGALYGQGHRANTRDGKWKPVTQTWRNWIGGEGASSGFSVHSVSKEKGGASVVLAESIGGSRSHEAIKTMSAIGIDVDSGTTVDAVVESLLDAGLFALVYTTFSHNGTEIRLKYDQVMRKMQLEEAPTRLEVLEYLRLHAKDRYDSEFISKITIKESRVQTEHGLQIVLQTPPLEKFRVILPLSEPVELADLANTVGEWKAVWADAVTGVAVNDLNSTFDSSSCDVNRLFYTPRHPKDKDDFYCAIVQGAPLNFKDITPSSKDDYVRSRGVEVDPFAEGCEDDVEVFLTESGMSLNDWHSAAKERFLITDVIEELAPDRLRATGSERDGTVHIECPFEHEHTSSGGTATMVMNPEENSSGYYTVFCKHDGCANRKKPHFIQQMLLDKWFEESVLTDEDFMLPLADQDMDDYEEGVEEEKPKASQTQDSIEEEKPKKPNGLDSISSKSSERQIRKQIGLLVTKGVDAVAKTKAVDSLVENSALGKRDILKIWKEEETEKRSEMAKEAKKDLKNLKIAPDVNEWNFDDQLKYVRARIDTANEVKPSFFEHMGSVSRVASDHRGEFSIQHMSKDALFASLTDITKWSKANAEGKKVYVKMPDAVLQYYYGSDASMYPHLEGIITTPVFTSEGVLLSEQGYDAGSALYYAPVDPVDFGTIPDEPTAKQVSDAVSLLVTEIFADFPIGGLSRDEIIDRVITNPTVDNAVPSMANMLGMLMLMLCRNMVEGPTPAHIITKPNPGVGASLLTETATLLAYGEEASAQINPKTEEEMGKVIMASLMSSSPVIYFDNISENVSSSTLASALTAKTYKGRILGKSETSSIAINAVWALTGNNVSMSSELGRRMNLISLDAKVANPEKRTGFRHRNVKKYVQANRGDLLRACFIIIQNYIAKGSLQQHDVTLNSFEEYSGVIGGILRDAGVFGFLGNRDKLKENYDEAVDDSFNEMLERWWEQFGETPVAGSSSASTLDGKSVNDMLQAFDIELDGVHRVRDSEGEFTYKKRSLGLYLGRHKDGVYIIKDDEGEEIVQVTLLHDSRKAKWKLEERRD